PTRRRQLIFPGIGICGRSRLYWRRSAADLAGVLTPVAVRRPADVRGPFGRFASVGEGWGLAVRAPVRYRSGFILSGCGTSTSLSFKRRWGSPFLSRRKAHIKGEATRDPVTNRRSERATMQSLRIAVAAAMGIFLLLAQTEALIPGAKRVPAN